MSPISRRTLVLGGLAAAGVSALPVRSAVIAATAATPYPFQLGVASGDPDSSSVVLWTRLAPSPLNADGLGGMAAADVVVDWQVSTTDTFSTLVASGSVTAKTAQAHSVHVIAGGLSPDFDYYYRFRAQGHLSPVGRTRTAPAAGTPGRELVMSFASCAHYEEGYYTAYRRMAEDNPGLILHLGDYIYEYGATTGRPRLHAGATEIVSLADYRRRYAQYKSDLDLQAAHAAAPWIVVPDDHEVENNRAGNVRADSTPSLTAAQWTARQAAAYQAYYENMPLRPAQANSGASIPLYRRLQWGSLASFHMLDTRQYRNDQACGDGWKVCSDADLASRSLPGNAQETWLLNGLNQKTATWDIIGQQVFFARRFNASGASMDSWDGYRASRARIQQGWVDRGTRNPVVLTGDVHRAWASDLKLDYNNANSATIGSELVCTSVSSSGDGDGATAIPDVGNNPWLKFFNNRRGYVRTTISPTQLRADFRAVAKVSEHGAPATTAKSFVIQDGQPGLQAV
ncbi:alkaline phosphatase [Kribbella sandramycini]|uniref:Alkaline phosphatase n=1 Tax=Kribbella sandramycini TaxID=60450 RepID=A0A7Y4NXH8_9ACTN|nr:alkaline phosphatase D family protein [Kribbella sandramycini]MBB6567919.1 alkaline phosphatase D [Kribbella sandramycini]NOL39486.1 alkaline phosphatase [Kribbella sandramycini]